jgi:hypothetical protein
VATSVPIPTGSYALPDPRASARRLVNCFSEIAPQTNYTNDSKQKAPPVVLRRAPGISAFASDGTNNPVRGMWMMAGVEYTVIGPTLYTVSSVGALTQVGTGIAGTGFVRMVDNTACLVILLPATRTAYTYTVANGLAQLTNTGFTAYGAIDLGFIDSYIVFLALDGREFFNDDGQAVSGSGPITFTSGAVFPREFGTDSFVGMAIQNRIICMLGQRTSEMYVDAGTPGTTNSPFTNAPDGYMELGMLPGTAYATVKQDNSLFWIASDKTVRRLNGQTPVRVSNHGIESILEHLDVTGSYGFPYSIGGHLFVALTFPAADAGRTLVYDCTTTEWHELSSYGLGYWRPLCCHNAFGVFLVGDSQSGQIGVLDTSVRTEWGTARSTKWTHQAVYDSNNRISHRRVELVLGGGFASLTGSSEAVTPQITLFASDDNGVTFRAFPTRSLGTTGNYTNRVTYFNAGISRQRVYKWELSADVQSWAVDMLCTLEGGRW